METQFETERLLLDLLTVVDKSFIFSLVNSRGWIENIGDRNVHSIEDSVNYILKLQNTPDLFYWVVRLKENNVPVGVISFLKRTYLEHFDIGFAFLPEFNGYGYAYEAASAVLTVVSNKAEHATILATTIPENNSSIKLLSRLGLRFERVIQLGDRTIQVYSNSSKQ